MLEGADIQIMTEYPTIAETLADMNLPVTMEVVSIMEYLGLTESEKASVETQEKIKHIYEYALTQGDPSEIIRGINCKVGYTQQPIVDRLYQYIRLNREIDATAGNLNNLLKQRNNYENSNNT